MTAAQALKGNDLKSSYQIFQEMKEKENSFQPKSPISNKCKFDAAIKYLVL